MNSAQKIIINEFGLNYELMLGPQYDIGIYTDMANIRKNILNRVKENDCVLNLYSYTGSFSLGALKSKAMEVHSVDLSKKYMNHLNRNLSLNFEEFNSHYSHVKSVNDALDDFLSQEKKFDIIICDPPSSSNDGKKTNQALKEYERILPILCELTSINGKIFIFLNTHHVKWNTFEKKIQSIVKSNQQISLEKRLKASGDCPTLKNFPEGEYLKGICLTKK